MKKLNAKQTIIWLSVIILILMFGYMATHENPNVKNEVTVQYLEDGEMVTEVLPTKHQWEQRLKELDATNTKYWISVER